MPDRFPYRRSPVAIAVATLLAAGSACAQDAGTAAVPDQNLGTITVNASADASAAGLSPAYAGGQVARGGRAGILGTQDNMDVPFSITSYTDQLIEDQQARTIGDVLQNDPSVRVARGFGNFQESYFIRGFILASDEIAYNGLYGVLPRQSIATELIERVEVLRGASAFLNGAAPGGGGIGGSINLVPKRAANAPLTEFTTSVGTGGAKRFSADISRRFGPDGSTGIRINAVHGEGGTGVDREDNKIDVLSAGVDWRSRDVRLSADVGYQNNKLKDARTSVGIAGLSAVPAAPDNTENWAQDWTHSYERDLFGTLRGEYDLNADWTAWAAVGARRSYESNVLDAMNVSNAATGDASGDRFDNNRQDTVRSGELGLRGKFDTGSVQHTVVASVSSYRLSSKNAYTFSNSYSTNLYTPDFVAEPTSIAFSGGDMSNPLVTSSNKFISYAIGDTMGFDQNRLLVTVGARHQKLDQRSYDYDTGAPTPGGLYDESRTSPMLGVVWKIRNNLSAYANYIESLSEGGVAPLDGSVSNPGQVFAPFVAKQKEVGLKYDAGRIGGGIAVFSTNKPGTYTDPATNALVAKGEDRHQGLELTVYGKATRDLKLLGGVTFLDAKQRDTAGGLTDGDRVIGVPKAQANIGAEWDVPGVQGLALDGQVVATGSSYADNANTLRVPGWTRLDLGARYLMQVNGKLLTLRARVENATNRDYWSSVGGDGASGYLVLGAPRTLTVSATVDF